MNINRNIAPLPFQQMNRSSLSGDGASNSRSTKKRPDLDSCNKEGNKSTGTCQEIDDLHQLDTGMSEPELIIRNNCATLIGNIAPKKVAQLPECVYTVEIGLGVSAQAVTKIPKYINCVKILSEVSTQVAAAIPKHVNWVIVGPNWTKEAVAVIRQESIGISGNLTPEVVAQISKDVTKVDIQSLKVTAQAIAAIPTTVRYVYISRMLLDQTVLAIPQHVKISRSINLTSEVNKRLEVLLELRKAYQLRAREQYGEAITMAESVLARIPNYAYAHKELSECYKKLYKDGLAFKHYWYYWKGLGKLDPEITLLERAAMEVLDQHDEIFSLGLADFNGDLIKLNQVLVKAGITHQKITLLEKEKGYANLKHNLLTLIQKKIDQTAKK